MLVGDLPYKAPSDEDILLLAVEESLYATKIKNIRALSSSFIPLGGGNLVPHSSSQSAAVAPYYLQVGSSCYWVVYPVDWAAYSVYCAKTNIVIPAGSLCVVRAYPMKVFLGVNMNDTPLINYIAYGTIPTTSPSSKLQVFALWDSWPPFGETYSYPTGDPSIVFSIKRGTKFYLSFYGESVVYFSGRQDIQFALSLSTQDQNQMLYLQASARYAYQDGAYTQVSINLSCSDLGAFSPGEVVVFQMERLL